MAARLANKYYAPKYPPDKTMSCLKTGHGIVLLSSQLSPSDCTKESWFILPLIYLPAANYLYISLKSKRLF